MKVDKDLDLHVDDDLLNGFLDESIYLLSEIDAALVSLEANPSDLSIVDAIFRPIHSIKGNAPFFGLTNLRTLAHEMESLLAKLRDGTLSLSSSQASVLLEGTDHLIAMLKRAQKRQPEVEDQGAFENLVKRVVEQQQGAASHETLWAELINKAAQFETMVSADSDLCPYFKQIDLILKQLAPAAAISTTPRDKPDWLSSIQDLCQQAHSQPSNSEFLDQIIATFERLKSVAHGDSLALLEKTCADLTPYFATIGFDALADSIVQGAITKLQRDPELSQPTSAVSAKPLSIAAADQQSASPQRNSEGETGEEKKADKHKVMRVSEEAIDQFLAYVGELFIFSEMLSYLERRLIAANASSEMAFEFSRLNESFKVLTQNLQRSLMAVRKVPVKGVLQKLPRIVRDIASARGKEISCRINGQELEVDKSLIELIDAPLVHMVRNSADHGVETPEDREKAGKPREGNVQIDVLESDKHIQIKVSDDGAGLNLEKIQLKAESLGLVKPGRPLTQEQIIDLLFQAGVSTAEKVTDVSGRGVGMDVVKRSIEEAGGHISVETKSGEGTTFILQLLKSVTTHIVESLVFAIDKRFYAVPAERVIEVFSCNREDLFSAAGKDMFLSRHDKIYPLVPACDVLAVPSLKEPHYQGRHVITVRANKREMAILVDEVLSVQQMVLKEVKKLGLKQHIYAGGALIGDGQIALLLELDRFCRDYDLDRLANHLYDFRRSYSKD